MSILTILSLAMYGLSGARWLCLIWAGVNGVNTGQIIAYGASPDWFDFQAIVAPLLAAVASHGGVKWLHSFVQKQTGSITAAACATLATLLQLREQAIKSGNREQAETIRKLAIENTETWFVVPEAAS